MAVTGIVYTQMANKVDDLEKEVTAQGKAMAVAESEITSLKESHKGLEEGYKKLQEENASLKTRITLQEHKK